MAVEVLRVIWKDGTSLPRKSYHDLESFIWVFHYALYMHAIKSLKLRGLPHEALYNEFAAIFGALDSETMISSRTTAERSFLPCLGEALTTLKLRILHSVNGDFILYRQKHVPQLTYDHLTTRQRMDIVRLGGEVKEKSQEVLKRRAEVLTYDTLMESLDLGIEMNALMKNVQ